MLWSGFCLAADRSGGVPKVSHLSDPSRRREEGRDDVHQTVRPATWIQRSPQNGHESDSQGLETVRQFERLRELGRQFGAEDYFSLDFEIGP